jgi:hypothetical protein
VWCVCVAGIERKLDKSKGEVFFLIVYDPAQEGHKLLAQTDPDGKMVSAINPLYFVFHSTFSDYLQGPRADRDPDGKMVRACHGGLMGGGRVCLRGVEGFGRGRSGSGGVRESGAEHDQRSPGFSPDC